MHISSTRLCVLRDPDHNANSMGVWSRCGIAYSSPNAISFMLSLLDRQRGPVNRIAFIVQQLYKTVECLLA